MFAGRPALKKMISVVSMALALVPGLGGHFAWACRENAMLVFDASGSMALFRDGRPKIDMARDAIADVLPDVTRFRPTGLVTYSGGRGPACLDVQLRVPPTTGSGNLILAEISGIQPSGATPLSDAVSLAVETLKGLNAPGIVVLVTDGLENCGQDACALAQKFKADSPNIRVHVVSFYLHGSAERPRHLPCRANRWHIFFNEFAGDAA